MTFHPAQLRKWAKLDSKPTLSPGHEFEQFQIDELWEFFKGTEEGRAMLKPYEDDRYAFFDPPSEEG